MDVEYYALGKLPAREDAVLFSFFNYFSKPDLPTPPKVFGVWQHFWNISSFQNERIGDCVFAGAANETASWHHEIKKWVKFNDEGVIADYSVISGYDGTKDSDKGADMGKSAEYRRKTGIVDHNGIRHTIDAYVKLHRGDFEDLKIAMYLFGAVGIGVEYPESAHIQAQTNQPWSVVSGKNKILGGHYIPGVGIDDNGDIVVVTWGRYQRMTKEFYEKYSDEAVGYFSLERLLNRTSPEGFDADKLIADLRSLKTPFGYSGFND